MMKIFIFSLLFLSTFVSLCQGRKQCRVDADCLNGGRCENSTRKCICPNNYFGEFCENKNECHKKCPDHQACVKKGNKTICTSQECSPVADIVFILDCSGSINKTEFDTMLKSVKTFVMSFDVAPDKIQMATFAFNDHISKRIIKLNDFKDRKSFLKELRNYAKDHTDGGTRTDKALKYLRTKVFTKANGDRAKAPNIALVFTDGRSNKPLLTQIESRKLKDTDINVISIGIGDGINKDELEYMATRKDDVFITDFDKLPSIVGKLVSKTCDVSLNPCASKPCKNGGKCRPFLTEYMCDCPHSYAGVNCDIKCNIDADIMFVIDESGSITLKKFGKIIDVAIHFIKASNIANGRVRIGILTFAKNVIPYFDLDAFENKLDMLFVTNLLRHMYRGGPTLTHKALRYLKKHSFTAERGDRLKYPNSAVIFTDGKSRRPRLTKRYARALHRSEVTVYAVGIGQNIRKKEIYYMASRPKQHHMLFTSFPRLALNMKHTEEWFCRDLQPKEPSITCAKNFPCPAGMKCCEGICIDTVTLAS